MDLSTADDAELDDGGEMPPQQEAGWASPQTRPLTAAGAAYSYPTAPLTSAMTSPSAAASPRSASADDSAGAGDGSAMAGPGMSGDVAAGPLERATGGPAATASAGYAGGKIRGEDVARHGIAYFTTLAAAGGEGAGEEETVGQGDNETISDGDDAGADGGAASWANVSGGPMGNGDAGAAGDDPSGGVSDDNSGAQPGNVDLSAPEGDGTAAGPMTPGTSETLPGESDAGTAADAVPGDSPAQGDPGPMAGASDGTAETSSDGENSAAAAGENAAGPAAAATTAPGSPTPPRKPKLTIQLGDAEIDALLQPIFAEIRRSGMGNMSPMDLYAYMKGTNLDTALVKPGHNPGAFYQYHGDKYPLLDGKTFSASDLNYLGVGAGFGARQFLTPEMNAAIRLHKWQINSAKPPSAETFAAAETGRQAYGAQEAWRVGPTD
ncbi:MAG TPA: hypothetical protein VGM54_02100 [Chthoniobacter sp.]|jgi:hypothetical protein